MPVDTSHRSYEAMRASWKRVRDCYGGRDAVIAAGEEYLSPLPGNPESDYPTRGNFYNGVRRTVQGLGGGIMQKAPVFDLPRIMGEEYLKDLTLGDVSAEMLAVDTIHEVLLTGRCGILVDMSSNPERKARPYAALYLTEDIVSWRLESVGGDDTLTRVILREVLEEPNPKDRFVTDTSTQYRVLELADNRYMQEVWKESSEGSGKYIKDEKEIVPTRRGDALPFIPFVFITPTSGSPEPERPPLLDLADVNLAHWRNSADHEYGLHLVALPTPWVSGHKDKGEGELQIGPSVVWQLEKEGRAGMLEFSGEGLAAIKTAMDKKEKMMATLGARLLEEPSSVQETATAVSMRHSGEHATLRMVAQSVEERFSRVLQIIAWWVGTEVKPEEVEAFVEFNKEFWAVRATPQEVQAALLAYQADGISFPTFYERLEKGGWAREGVTAEEELKEIARGGGGVLPPASKGDGGD